MLVAEAREVGVGVFWPCGFLGVGRNPVKGASIEGDLVVGCSLCAVCCVTGRGVGNAIGAVGNVCGGAGHHPLDGLRHDGGGKEVKVVDDVLPRQKVCMFFHDRKCVCSSHRVMGCFLGQMKLQSASSRLLELQFPYTLFLLRRL